MTARSSVNETSYATWERRALEELNHEYRHVLRERRVDLRPAFIQICDSETNWARWISETRTIEMSRRLLRHHPWFQVVGILKHEMAHQLVDESREFRRFADEKMHGEGFGLACKRLGVPSEYARASADLQTAGLDWRTDQRDDTSERMLEKVRKLLALATSANEHEAALAMNRVREIYAKYNLEDASRPQFVHLVLTNGTKRMEVHEKKIIGILVGHFFVQVITGQTYDVASGERHRMFEIIGRRENVLMAEYVYHFLLKQTEALVDKMAGGSRKLDRVTRKSYRLGILHGFAEKLAAAEMPASPQTRYDRDANHVTAINLISSALVAFNRDKKLGDYIATIYPRLRNVSTGSHRIDASAYAAGKTAGRRMTLNKAVGSADGNRGRMLNGGR